MGDLRNLRREYETQKHRADAAERECDKWRELCEEHIRADSAKEGEGIPPVMIPAATLGMALEKRFEVERERDKWNASAERLAHLLAVFVEGEVPACAIVTDTKGTHYCSAHGWGSGPKSCPIGDAQAALAPDESK